jgi:CheY-like chemotaxis protein
VLSALGHQPVTRLALESGPDTVRDVGADALLIDLQRPDEDDYGLRMIEDLRTDPEIGDLPIILCSGAPEALRPLQNRLAGLRVPIVVKPFAIDELEMTLQGALRAR